MQSVTIYRIGLIAAQPRGQQRIHLLFRELLLRKSDVLDALHPVNEQVHQAYTRQVESVGMQLQPYTDSHRNRGSTTSKITDETSTRTGTGLSSLYGSHFFTYSFKASPQATPLHFFTYSFKASPLAPDYYTTLTSKSKSLPSPQSQDLILNSDPIQQLALMTC